MPADELAHAQGLAVAGFTLAALVAITAALASLANAGLSASALRARYGDKLALIGGICNNHILPRGSREQIREHVLDVLAAGSGGGLVIGTHSIGPDIPVESYDYFTELRREFGRYPMDWAIRA